MCVSCVCTFITRQESARAEALAQEEAKVQSLSSRVRLLEDEKETLRRRDETSKQLQQEVVGAPLLLDCSPLQ